MRLHSNPATGRPRRLKSMLIVGSVALVVAATAGGPTSANAEPNGGGATVSPVRAIPANDPDRGMIFDGLEQVPESACKTGLRVKGTNLCTHGPDTAPDGLDIRKSAAPVSGRASAQAVECNGDGGSGLRTHVIYARSSDVADRYAAFLPSFRTWAEGADTIYNASAAETGGSRRLRYVHDAACNVTVANVVMTPTGDDNFGNTITELTGLGYNRTDRKYMIFVDAFVYCGIGTFNWTADQAGPDNINNIGPSYGRSDAGCWNADTIAHEHMHNIGGVQLSAPFTSLGAHCVDEYDLMCYSDSPNFPAMQYICPEAAHNSRFDCNHNDYYSTNPPVGSYLRTHWNTADSLYLTGGQRWGYVWADQPSAASYTPSTFYQRNSSGALNTITRSGVGNYTVRFTNLAVGGGTVSVTAYSGTTHMCKVGSWGSSGADQVVNVRCFTNTGVAADTYYTASFTRPTQSPGDIGFVWASQPATASYTPSTTYQFNSTGATNTIIRSGVGNYLVYMPGLGTAPNGHVKVTAYGADSNACKVGYWSQIGGLRVINVLCFNAAGAAADAFYTVTYSNALSGLGVTGAATGYVWADQPASASYTPSPIYQFNSTGGSNTITRSGAGNYLVSFPGIGQDNGHVQVTAYGSGNARCKVGFWFASGGALVANVLCTTPAGAAVDAYYTASYTR